MTDIRHSKFVKEQPLTTAKDFVAQFAPSNKNSSVDVNVKIEFGLDEMEKEAKLQRVKVTQQMLSIYTKLYTKTMGYQYLAECIDGCHKKKNLAPQLVFQINFQQHSKNANLINKSIEGDNRFYFDQVYCPVEDSVQEMKLIQYRDRPHLIIYHCLSCKRQFDPSESQE